MGVKVHPGAWGWGRSVCEMASESGDQVQAPTLTGSVTSDSEVASLSVTSPASSSVLRGTHMRPGDSGGHLGQTELVVMTTEQGNVTGLREREEQ